MNREKNHLLHSIRIPLVFVAAMWAVKAIEHFYNVSFYELGIYPLTVKGVPGILTSPFIHKDFNHLISNTFPLLISAAGIIYFYPNIAFRAMVGMYLMTGIWIWCFARPSFHIGASGLVYSFVFFLFFSGVLRKDRAAMAVSLLVTFLYGSIVWGILPLIEEVSWEAHLMGTLAGIFFAWYYRKSGGPTPKHEWDEEEPVPFDYLAEPEEQDAEIPSTENNSAGIDQSEPRNITYHYVPDQKKEED